MFVVCWVGCFVLRGIRLPRSRPSCDLGFAVGRWVVLLLLSWCFFVG